jgi:HlyD family secretion protein
LKVKFLDTDDNLRPDMNATVNFYNEVKPTDSAAEAGRVVVIPASAVQNGTVFVALNGRAKKIAVTTGGTTAQGVLIQSGLSGGEDLIVNPTADLKNGQRVEAKQQ